MRIKRKKKIKEQALYLFKNKGVCYHTLSCGLCPAWTHGENIRCTAPIAYKESVAWLNDNGYKDIMVEIILEGQ